MAPSTSCTVARAQPAPSARRCSGQQGRRQQDRPRLLCDEDDVAGNHGATIGHVRDEQLFYSPAAALTKTPPRTCSSVPSWRTPRFPPPTSAPAPPSSVWATT
ncbi:MAG: SufD family Fe-S cluster assembly protein [Collinsella aerofaciens]